VTRIVGVGLDAVEIARMRAVLDRTPRLAERAFTDDERAYCVAKRDPIERFAVRWAAKEAVLKVLGEGILRVPLRTIEVVRASTGEPSIRVTGRAAERAAARGITSWQVSLTHTEASASAVVIGLHDDEADPAGSPAGYYASLDRKRNAAGALLWDGAGRLLVVEPTYRPGWTLPGGTVDAGESPRQACEREITEELGLRRRVGRLLAVEWLRGDEVRGEQQLFLFDGGVLSEAEVGAIKLPADELGAFAFVAPDEAVARLGPPEAARRLAAVLVAPAGAVLWMDDGAIAGATPGPA
jgi:phosphopantetheine--protein transferase-like protein